MWGLKYWPKYGAFYIGIYIRVLEMFLNMAALDTALNIVVL